MSNDKEMMPVLSSVRRENPTSPKEIPMEWLSESRALMNHGQSLKRLKERGGMSYAEMWLNIHDASLRQLLSESEAINYLKDRLKNSQP